MRKFDLDFNNRKFVAYGAGGALLGLREAHEIPFAYVIDDTPGFAGQKVDGLSIYGYDQIEKENLSDLFVVICAQTPPDILAISSKLNRLGLRYGEQYLDCSFFQFQSMSRQMKAAFGISTSYDRFSRSRVHSLYGNMNNLSSPAGTWLFLELIDQVLRDVPGKIAECGVFQGGNAMVSCLMSEALRKRVYQLFDTFEGFPKLTKEDPQSRQEELKGVDFEQVRDMFNNFEQVEIHKGFFNQTIPKLEDAKYAMVYVDCDLYSPTLYLCDYFWDRLSDGGCMLFHDYWVPEGAPAGAPDPFRGIQQAVTEFFGPKGQEVLVFSETSHAVVIKQ